MKKILVAFLLSLTIFGIYPKNVEAIETYDVIYGEVSRYHRGAKEIAWIAMAILYAADTYQVDPLLITSIMESESSFNFKAISVAGAVGLMQLMPETAREIGVNPYVPLQNVIGGTINLKNQLNRFAIYGDNALINADLNGAANILRKSKQNFNYEELCAGLSDSHLKIKVA